MQGKCKLVSDFKERTIGSHLDSLHLFSEEFEHAFPMYTMLKKIDVHSRKPSKCFVRWGIYYFELLW